jgi:hypothetical protein
MRHASGDFMIGFHRLFLASDSGTTAVITAFAAFGLAGAAGIGITMVQKNNLTTAAQAALDAGALAGQSGVKLSNERRLESAKAAFAANWQELAPDNLAPPKTQFTFSGNVLRGTVQANFPGTFSSLFGVDEISINAIAEAIRVEGGPVCVMAMAKTDEETLYAYGNASFEAKNCAVQSNSKSAESIAKSWARAEAFYTTGKARGSGWTPAPVTDSPPLEDPYAHLPVPAPGACDQSNLVIKSDTTLSPGTYCGGLSVMTGAVVTLNPGIYIMKDGAFSVTSQASVSGDKVMIALVGKDALIDIQSGGSVSVTSPTEGIYKNMQFMSDRTVADSWKQQEWTNIQGGAKLEFDGVMYLPEQNFWVVGTAHQTVVKGYSPTMAMIADTYWYQGNTVVEVERIDRRGIGTSDLPELNANSTARLIK